MTPTRQPHPYDQRARLIELRSAVLGVQKRLFVYAPPGYEDAPGLPVLYLLRGHEREWVNPSEDRTRRGWTIIDVYEALLKQGRIGPLLLVCPSTASDDNSVPGLLVDFKQPALTTKRGIGTGQYETYFVQELMPFIARQFRTASACAVEGFSLGGYQAVKIAAQHPRLFRSVGAFDGTFMWDDKRHPLRVARNDPVFHMPFFNAAFGVPRDYAWGGINNPTNLVRNGDPLALRRLRWIIDYGPRSAEPDQSNYYRGERLLRMLREQGIENQGRGALNHARHTWHWNHEHMRHALPLHWQALQAAPPV